MLISTLLRLIFIAIITVFLVTRSEIRKIGYFSEQSWTVEETFPVYWAFVLLSLISLMFYRNISDKFVYQVISYMISLLGGFILYVGIKIIISKKKLSLKVIGLKPSYIFWFLTFILIQYIILFAFFSGKAIQDFSLFIWSLAYFSIVLAIWPIIEEFFFLGMLFIPTSRKVGIVTGAVIVSLLQTLVHFNHTAAELAINFVTYGLLACYLYIKTRGVLAPVLLHSLLNFFVLLRDLKFISVGE